MKAKMVLSICLMVFILPAVGWTAVLDVVPGPDADCSDGFCDLPSALVFSATNGEADTLNLQEVIYPLDAGLVYQPINENFALSIIGQSPDATILEGDFPEPVLTIDTTGMGDDSNADIFLDGLGFNNASHSRGELDLEISCDQADITIGSIEIQSPNGSVEMTTSSGTIEVTGSVNSGNGSISFEVGNPHLGTGIPDEDIIVWMGGGDVTVSPGASIDIHALEAGTINLNAVPGIEIAGEISAIGWVQTNGPPVEISVDGRFVAPPVGQEGGVVTLLRTIEDEQGNEHEQTFNYLIQDNGVTGFPATAIPFTATTGKYMAVEAQGGAFVALEVVDPATIGDENGKPRDMTYGLLDFEIKVNQPGDTAKVTVYLDQAAPQGYGWFKYSLAMGWTDFSANAQYNGDRTQVVLTLTDGGPGDDDGVADGVIRDPGGPGLMSSSSGCNGTGESGGECFIGCLF